MTKRAKKVPVDRLPRCPNEHCHATLGADGRCASCDAGGMSAPEASWRAFVESRPEGPCRDAARKVFPNRRYRLAETGADYYHVHSVCEDGTVTAVRFNATSNEPLWRVFGIEPDELIVVEEKPWAEFGDCRGKWI